MYKVFLNDRILMLDSEGNSKKGSSDSSLVKIDDEDDLKYQTDRFLRSSEESILFIHPDIDWLWAKFKECFLNVRAAGGIVKKEDLILFIFRRGKWDLPKGKIDAGETAEEAALREVGEECGISGMHILTALSSTWHIYRSSWHTNTGKWILKETCWFEMRYTGNASLCPQTDEDITKAEWISPARMHEMVENTYPNLQPVIRRYL